MHTGFLVLGALSALLQASGSPPSSRLQVTLPRRQGLLPPDDADIHLDDTFLNDDLFKEQSDINAEHVRQAILSLLSLNDGELQLILKGLPAGDLADALSPSTSLFLKSSRGHLNTLRSLAAQDMKAIMNGDMRISKRDKGRKHSTADLNEDSELSTEYSDSLLEALAKVSEALSQKDLREESQLISSSSAEDINERESSSSNKVDSSSNSLLPESDLRDFEDPSSSKDLEGLVKKFDLEQKEREDKKRKERRRKERRRRNRRKRHHAKTHYSIALRTHDCPLSSDGYPQNYCPSPTASGDWICIEDFQICNDIVDCPGGEDEQHHECFYFNAMKHSVEQLTNAFIMYNRRS